MNREKMIELRDALRAFAGAVNVRLDTGIDEILRSGLRELTRALELELGFHLIELTPNENRILGALAKLNGAGSVQQLLQFLAASICDGIRRPGAWERDVVDRLFGPDVVAGAEPFVEAAYRRRPYREPDELPNEYDGTNELAGDELAGDELAGDELGKKG